MSAERLRIRSIDDMKRIALEHTKNWPKSARRRSCSPGKEDLEHIEQLEDEPKESKVWPEYTVIKVTHLRPPFRPTYNFGFSSAQIGDHQEIM